jgi:hypothetical protein
VCRELNGLLQSGGALEAILDDLIMSYQLFTDDVFVGNVTWKGGGQQQKTILYLLFDTVR